MLKSKRARFTRVLAAALALAGAAPAAAGANDYFGVVAGSEVFIDQQRDAHLSLMLQYGIGVVRLDASWAQAEPTGPADNGGAHVYHWEAFDEKATVLANQGL